MGFANDDLTSLVLYLIYLFFLALSSAILISLSNIPPFKTAKRNETKTHYMIFFLLIKHDNKTNTMDMNMNTSL